MNTTTTRQQKSPATHVLLSPSATPSDVDPLADIITGTSNDISSTQTPQGLVAPLWRLIVTSEYGDRIHPVRGTRSFHRGVDFGARTGTPVRAAAAGVVVWASELGPYGTLIVIDHGHLHTAYGHLDTTQVDVGQQVRAAQRIGRVGSTGLATGPHLHFEVRDNGTPRNPSEWITTGAGRMATLADIVESRIR